MGNPFKKCETGKDGGFSIGLNKFHGKDFNWNID